MDWIDVAAAVTAAGAAGGAFWIGIPHADRIVATGSLARRCRERRALVLTYDDGPGPALTPRVLQELGAAGARATFFVLGSRATRHPHVVDLVAAAGHEIACHSMDHRHAWRSGPLAAVSDQERGYEALRRWIPDDAPYRPPYGKLTFASWLAARRRRRPLSWWTLVSGDTYDETPSVASVVDRARGSGGGVVLLHDFDREDADAAGRAEFVVALTRALLEMARSEGLRVVPLRDL